MAVDSPWTVPPLPRAAALVSLAVGPSRQNIQNSAVCDTILIWIFRPFDLYDIIIHGIIPHNQRFSIWRKAQDMPDREHRRQSTATGSRARGHPDRSRENTPCRTNEAKHCVRPASPQSANKLHVEPRQTPQQGVRQRVAQGRHPAPHAGKRPNIPRVGVVWRPSAAGCARPRAQGLFPSTSPSGRQRSMWPSTGLWNSDIHSTLT